MQTNRPIYLITAILLIACTLPAQIHNTSWKELINTKDSKWYASAAAERIAENVILYQRDIGGWPKNIQIHEALSKEETTKISESKSKTSDVTIDNGATTQEMIFLSKIYEHHPSTIYKDAFFKGLDYLLIAQYDNGGWPQYYPLRKGYYSHITYNDGAMINTMRLLQKILNQEDNLSITISKETLKKTRDAFEKGIACILSSQFIQSGKLTAWCAQHDVLTLAPTKARSYELPSLSGSESVGIIELLMSIDNPNQALKTAINSAMTWIDTVKILGLREVRTYKQGKVINKVMIRDSLAEPLWARFMELEDNTPFFCDRDGIKKQTVADIGAERRNGYKWHTTEPIKLHKKYIQWQQKHGTEDIYLKKKKTRDPRYIVVSTDGTGDFTSIQKAINNCKSFPYERITIYIKNGVYQEKVKLHEWNSNITLLGENKEKTIITYDDYFNKMKRGRNSTFHTYTLLVEANDVTISNLTIQNTAGRVGQAVALSVFSHRVVIDNCKLLGNQDTLYASGIGKQYYKNCYIEGTTDFIFGSATALFENCQIHSKKNSYITAAATPEGSKYGYVFKNCSLTANDDVTQVYLGRPWRIHAKTVFIQCKLGSHIRQEGWHNWSKPAAEKTTFYAEYKNSGIGYQPDQRVKWSHQLNKSKAKKYTTECILATNNSSLTNKWYESN